VKRAWLELIDWEFVTATNAALCQPKKALHKPTSDGHDRTRQLWQKNHRREMLLDEAAELCRECHRRAPFCNFNGNTFAAIARSLVDTLKLKADKAHVVRSLLGFWCRLSKALLERKSGEMEGRVHALANIFRPQKAFQ